MPITSITMFVGSPFSNTTILYPVAFSTASHDNLVIRPATSSFSVIDSILIFLTVSNLFTVSGKEMLLSTNPSFDTYNV